MAAGRHHAQWLVPRLLLLEAAAAAGLGLWLLLGASAAPSPSGRRTGDVVGPGGDLLDGFILLLRAGTGAVALGLGVFGLCAGVAWLRSGPRAWTVAAVFAFAMPWAIVAATTLLGASRADESLTAWLAASGVAATVALLHVPAALAGRRRAAVAGAGDAAA